MSVPLSILDLAPIRGRAPGTDMRTALALRSTSPNDFHDQLAQLRGHLGDGQGRPAPLPTVEQAEELLPKLGPNELQSESTPSSRSLPPSAPAPTRSPDGFDA